MMYAGSGEKVAIFAFLDSTLYFETIARVVFQVALGQMNVRMLF